MSARRLVAGAAALAALLAPAASADAQVTHGWSLCFTSAISSCSDFALTTTPLLVGAARTGTLVDLLVRHRQGGGVVSGLQDVAFYFAGAGDGDDPGLRLTPEPLLGAPAVPAGAELGWLVGGRSTLGAPAEPPFNYLVFSTVALDQFVGGCLGGAFDAAYQSPLATCGAQAYRMRLATPVQLDADAVSAFAVTVYAGDGNGDFFPDQAFCYAPAGAGAVFGYDFGDFASGAVCGVGALAVVPEPAPLPPLGAALGILGAAVAARRRRA